jgi:hypothetical protein
MTFFTSGGIILEKNRMLWTEFSLDSIDNKKDYGIISVWYSPKTGRNWFLYVRTGQDFKNSI